MIRKAQFQGCYETKPHLVLFLQRQSKAIDYAPKDLQQLGYPCMPLSLKNKAVEHIIDGLSDKGPVDHELPINPMEDRLQVVPLSWVFRIEKFQQFEDEFVIDMLLGMPGLCVC